jgi:RNA polymerase-binding transcription factor DksA
MSQLSKSDLQSVENKLNERKNALLEEVRKELDERENQHLATVMGNHPGDSGDVSLADWLADLNILRVNRQIHELREIEAKLSQVKDGMLNECVDCGKEIGLQRLLAYPTATRCMACQEKHERMYQHGAHPGL